MQNKEDMQGSYSVVSSCILIISYNNKYMTNRKDTTYASNILIWLRVTKMKKTEITGKEERKQR